MYGKFSSNKDLLKQLNKKVYGHIDVKKSLINLLNKSRLRFLQEFVFETPKDQWIKNNNMLLIGNSGSGKTHLVKTICELCEVPLVMVDATQLLPSGSGSSGVSAGGLEKLIIKNAERLVQHENISYPTVEGAIAQTIVFVDEIDKLAKSFESSGNWNKHVQSNFLTIFENSGDKEGLNGVSFIFAGAFTDLELENKVQKSIGFTKQDDCIDEIDVEEAVIKYGLIPELIGRIDKVAVLNKLSKEDMLDILDQFVLPSIINELKLFSINKFELDDNTKNDIAEKAAKSNMGVRYLTKQVRNRVDDLLFEFEEKADEIEIHTRLSKEEIERAYNDFLLDSYEGDK